MKASKESLFGGEKLRIFDYAPENASEVSLGRNKMIELSERWQLTKNDKYSKLELNSAIFQNFFGFWGPFNDEFWNNVFSNNLLTQKYLGIHSVRWPRQELIFETISTSGLALSKKDKSISCFLKTFEKSKGQYINPRNYWMLFVQNEYLLEGSFSGSLREWLEDDSNVKKANDCFDKFHFNVSEHTRKLLYVFSLGQFGTLTDNLSAKNLEKFLDLNKKQWIKIVSLGDFVKSRPLSGQLIETKLNELESGSILSPQDIKIFYEDTMTKSLIKLCSKRENEAGLAGKVRLAASLTGECRISEDFAYSLQAKKMAEETYKNIDLLSFQEFICLVFGLINPDSWISGNKKDSWLITEKFIDSGKYLEFAKLAAEYVFSSTKALPNAVEWKKILENDQASFGASLLESLGIPEGKRKPLSTKAQWQVSAFQAELKTVINND